MDLHRFSQTADNSCNVPTPAPTPRHLNLAQVGGHYSGRASPPLAHGNACTTETSEFFSSVRFNLYIIDVKSSMFEKIC